MIGIGIGIAADFLKITSQQNGNGDDIDWGEFWETRAPGNANIEVIGDSSALVTWDDALETSDGLKIYISPDKGITRILKATVNFGIEEAIIADLDLNTEYDIYVAAYKGGNESDPAEARLSWAKWMLYSYTDVINTHAEWTDIQKTNILSRLEENYVVSTFGPDGSNKTACDFFIYFDAPDGKKKTRAITKSGGTLRWNYGDGNIYTQNNIPGEISTDAISVTSTDGFGGITVWLCSGNFSGNIPNISFYFSGCTNFSWSGSATMGSPYRTKGDITAFQPWLVGMVNLTIAECDIVGNISEWRIPDGLRTLNLSGCSLLTPGSSPVIPATWNASGSFTFNLSGTNRTSIPGEAFVHTKTFSFNLSNNYLSSAEIKSLINRLHIYYSNNPPQANMAIDVTGVYNGTLADGESDDDLVGLQSIFTTAGRTLTCTFNEFDYLLIPLDNPTLVITMDDDTITDYTKILPMLSGKGLAGTSYRYGSWVAGHQTITEVNALISAGWCVAAHPEFNPSDDETAIRKVIEDIQDFFTDNSIPMFRHCSYSGGYHNALVQSIITDYCDTARTSGQFSNEDYTNRGNLIYKDNDITALRANSCDSINENIVTAAKNKIDQAKVKSAGVIIYFHGVTDEDVVLLEEIIDYAIGLNFDIVTIDGLYEKIIA